VELRARITSKGQLTIPREVRRALGVKEGDSLLFEIGGGDEVRVRVARKPISFADYAGVWREGEGMSAEEVNAYVGDLRGHES